VVEGQVACVIRVLSKEGTAVIIVTGGAGFIGSNLVHYLNRLGEQDILVVDNFAPSPNLTGPKFINLLGAQFADYMDKHEFRIALSEGKLQNAGIRAILHQGACSNTLEDDGRYMMDNNFTYSKELLHFAVERQIPLVYASTAAVYGANTEFEEISANERPLNVYGYSKLVFDDYVRRLRPHFKSTVVGLRYFNVYGPREQHKGRMASVMHHFTRQLKETGKIRMFEGSGGYADGEQRRDFVFVEDLAKINVFFAGLGSQAGAEDVREPTQAIVNAGTGDARTFKAVAEALMKVHGSGAIEYIPFPGDLKDRYQHFTQADIRGLRAAGYVAPFTSLEEGIHRTFVQEPAK
jgi:ADP-L-glycero-D-manno-heptose 6-epimerase